jgi:paraquat-inducible protein B
MTDERSNEDSATIEKAIVKRKKGISPIWILPIVAALIGAWLLYKGIVDAPIKIVINFDTVEGITAGKTKVLYKGLEAGMVKSVDIHPDLKTVDVTVAFDPKGKNLLLDTTEFWLVEPRVSLRGITGLSTLLKGDYINMRAKQGDGKRARRFKALAKPPAIPDSAPGLHLTLISEDLGSISSGTPVLYKKEQVGDVQSYKLSDDQQHLEIKIYINPEYSHLVKKHSRFWNASGIEVEGGASGLKIRTQSMVSILVGGIAFFTPEAVGDGRKAESGGNFKLYTDYDSAHETGVAIQITFKGAEGLEENTKIQYRGITVGTVDSVVLSKSLDKVVVSAHLDPHARAFAREGTRFWIVEPEVGLAKVSHLGTLITGNYIEVRPAKKKGKFKTKFVGLLTPPMEKSTKTGLNIKLTADQLGSIKEGDKVYYREIVVGHVASYELAKTADQVLIHLSIQQRFAPLVRENTVFWNASGIGVSWSLFKGLHVHTESLESILAGGVAFATPDNDKMGKRAKQNAVFPLYAEVKDEWLKWKPTIKLPDK